MPYLIYALLLLPPLIIAQTSMNITLGSSLKAGEPASKWLSQSQDFAFGFQETDPGTFLLAIWFDNIPEKTITWSANRDDPTPSGSIIELTPDNGLVLTDPSGREIWRTKLLTRKNDSTNRIAYAVLFDSGNFALLTQESAIIWQSFDEPTDTLLPTQKLNVGDQLLASFTRKNYSSGRFSFKLQDSSNLALFTTSYPFYNAVNTYYWTYSTRGVGHHVVFNQSGFLHLVAENGSIVTDMFPKEESEKQEKQAVYQRVILEYDGVLRHYVYLNQASQSGGGWLVKSFAPDNICTALLEQTGGGVCGYNGYCKIGNDRKPHCRCPPGYTRLEPDDEMSGCFQDFAPHSCEESVKEKNEFDMKVLQDVDWPMADYEHFTNVSIDWCREACLEDCFCVVGVFRVGGDCWKKKLPLLNGKNDSSVARAAFVKVRTRGGGSISTTRYKRSRIMLTAVGATLGSVNMILLGIVIFVFSFFAYRKKTKISGIYNVRRFTFNELNEATDGFSQELGRGASGVVYKGVLSNDHSSSRTLIAVKKLNFLSQNADKEFRTEVNSIGNTHHKSLVKLLGYCEEDEERLLVYEFMSNGSLSDFLHQSPKPAWEKRLRITQGIARGLAYLHEDCSTKIIHCDIKPQNILLDDDYNARISDFGLAKLLRLDQTHTNTAPRGTTGYVAPEWFANMPITDKVDVFSFGILLLEIICCQRNAQSEEEGVVPLTEWAFDCCQMGTVHELVKDDMEALNDEERLVSMVKIALWCAQDDPGLRPVMRKVVAMLEGLVQVPEPPSLEANSSSNHLQN